MNSTKICNVCGITQPSSTDFFSWASPKKTTLKRLCRACERARERGYRLANPERYKQNQRRQRAADPEKARERDRRYYAQNKKRGRAAARRWRERNPEKAKEVRRRYYAANADKAREAARQYQKANSERVSLRQAKYRRSNADEIRRRERELYAAQRQHVLSLKERWRRANPEKARAIWRRRRARKCAAAGRHSGEDIQTQITAQASLCYWCQEPVGDDYEVDHIFPLSKGGSDGPENICISCRSCNRKKHVKMPWEFAGRLF